MKYTGKNITIQFGEPTFFGQILDCPDNYYTLWHACPQCKNALIYCECENMAALIEELNYLYRTQQTVILSISAHLNRVDRPGDHRAANAHKRARAQGNRHIERARRRAG